MGKLLQSFFYRSDWTLAAEGRAYKQKWKGGID